MDDLVLWDAADHFHEISAAAAVHPARHHQQPERFRNVPSMMSVSV